MAAVVGVIQYSARSGTPTLRVDELAAGRVKWTTRFLNSKHAADPPSRDFLKDFTHCYLNFSVNFFCFYLLQGISPWLFALAMWMGTTTTLGHLAANSVFLRPRSIPLSSTSVTIADVFYNLWSLELVVTVSDMPELTRDYACIAPVSLSAIRAISTVYHDHSRSGSQHLKYLVLKDDNG